MSVHVLLMCLHYYGTLYYHNTKCTADTPPLVSEMKKLEAITSYIVPASSRVQSQLSVFGFPYVLTR